MGSSRRTATVVRLSVVLLTVLTLLLGQTGSVRAQDQASASRSLLDSTRAGAGVAPLQPDSRLDGVAEAQAYRMAEDNAIYHNPNLGEDARAAGVNWSLIAENVGVGRDVREVHDAFTSSSGHYANMVHPDHNLIGVGVAMGSGGDLFVAHVFARVSAPAPMEVSAAEDAPSPPAATATARAGVPPSERPLEKPASPPQTRSATPNALLHGVVNR